MVEGEPYRRPMVKERLLNTSNATEPHLPVAGRQGCKIIDFAAIDNRSRNLTFQQGT
ncbi:MAG: hypothetical protein LBU24_02140 [Methanocalculaceae archaeon]|jgi:hypothetical protein|nr:hypothetical protein [Methanocalculaceae archaeon]